MNVSRLFNIQNQKYQTVSCTICGFTELYRLDGSGLGNVVDLFVG
jgi:predicted nucleic-acid-binding Zn-ribbon protein